MPERIQLRRTKGWRKPEGVIIVSRPSKWGNPYRIGDNHPIKRGFSISTNEEAVNLFRWSVVGDPEALASIQFELRDKDLACWCALDVACHADVLLHIANS